MDKLTKLSQAIRLGSTFRPQCRNAHFKDGGSCALDAALEAATGFSDEAQLETRLGCSPWHYLAVRFGVPRDEIRYAAILNDSGASRESIADYLEANGL